MTVTQPLTLENLLARNISVPVCPSVFLRLVEALNNPDQQNDKIGQLISSDPAVTSQILKCANSAYYAVTRTVRSVEEAVTRLGYAEICSIAMACKGKEMFKSQSAAHETFFKRQWDHALVAGVCARTIARRLNPALAECHFTVGILHDIGKLMLVQSCPDYLTQINEGRLFGDEAVAVERNAYGTHHAALGAELLHHWKIPDLVVKPIAQHHEAQAPEDFTKDACILALANHMAHSIDTDVLDGNRKLSVSLPQSLAQRAGLTLDDFFSISREMLKHILMLRTL